MKKFNYKLEIEIFRNSTQKKGVLKQAGDFVTKLVRNQTDAYLTAFVTTISYPKEIDWIG